MKFATISLALTLIALGVWWIAGLQRDDPVTIEPIPIAENAGAAETSDARLDQPDLPVRIAEQTSGTDVSAITEQVQAELSGTGSSGPNQAPPTMTALERVRALEEKYKGLSSPDMRRMAVDMHAALRRRESWLLEERHKSGLYEAIAFQLDARGRIMPAHLSMPEAPDGIVSKAFRDEKTKQWHYVVLPRDEYPDFYAERDEQNWLIQTVRRREEPGKEY